jgi:hypothetical protein
MFHKNMADWGLHNGKIFFTILSLIFNKKKIFLPLSPRYIVLKNHKESK